MKLDAIISLRKYGKTKGTRFDLVVLRLIRKKYNLTMSLACVSRVFTFLLSSVRLVSSYNTVNHRSLRMFQIS